MKTFIAILALMILVGSSVYTTADAWGYGPRHYRYNAPAYYGYQPYFGYRRYYRYRPYYGYRYGYRPYYRYRSHYGYGSYWWGLDPNILLDLRRDNYRQ
jgi:hypothetical protein